MRDNKFPGHILAFDNLKGSPDDGWLFGDNRKTKRRNVIEVSPEGASLQFRFFLQGTGSVWAADFTLESWIKLSRSQESLTGD